MENACDFYFTRCYHFFSFKVKKKTKKSKIQFFKYKVSWFWSLHFLIFLKNQILIWKLLAAHTASSENSLLSLFMSHFFSFYRMYTVGKQGRVMFARTSHARRTWGYWLREVCAIRHSPPAHSFITTDNFNAAILRHTKWEVYRRNGIFYVGCVVLNGWIYCFSNFVDSKFFDGEQSKRVFIWVKMRMRN